MKIFRDSSYWIILVLLAIMCITAYLLFRNITRGASGNDNVVIGTLTFKRKTIERKYDSDVIWEKIESGLVIRNKDTIRSGEYSDAVLTLTDNTKININENSMIYLDVTEGDINLNFAYGSMSLAKNEGDAPSTSTVKIKSGQNTVEVKNSDLVLEKKGKDELSFQVKNGTAKFSNGNEEKELKANESASISNEEIKIAEVNLNLLSPADGSIISERLESIPVSFTWTSHNAKKLELEIAFDSRFQKMYKSISVDNDSLTTNLKQGNYYWRISSEKRKNKKKSERDYSVFRKLAVYSISPPILLSPQKNQIYKFTNVTPIVPFNWKRLETAANYRLEISKNSDFSVITKTFSTNQLALGVDNLEPGKYFARLIAEPIRDEFKQEKSEPISFSLEKQLALEPPSIVSPTNGQEFNTYLFSKSGVSFQVSDSPEISSYTFQISTDSNFSKILLEKQGKTNQVKFTHKLDIGEYYWRVFGNSNDGRKTPYSEIRKFSLKENQVVELVSPKNNSFHDIKNNPLSFQWKRQAYKSNFILEISNTPEFTEKIQSIKTAEYSASFPIKKEGTYYWRVVSLADDETILSKSTVFSFQAEEEWELIPIYPIKNAKIDMTPLDSLQFKWEKHPKAKSFIFELFKDKVTPRNLVVKSKTKSSSFIFKDLDKLDEGNFIWTLQELRENDKQNYKEKVISVPFKIFLSEKPVAPEIKSPKKVYVE